MLRKYNDNGIGRLAITILIVVIISSIILLVSKTKESTTISKYDNVMSTEIVSRGLFSSYKTLVYTENSILVLDGLHSFMDMNVTIKVTKTNILGLKDNIKPSIIYSDTELCQNNHCVEVLEVLGNE